MRLISRPGPDSLRRSRFPRLSRRVLQTVFVLFLIWTAAEVTGVQRRLSPLVPVDERISRKSQLQSERVFVVGIHWNNEWILRNYWNQAVADLAQTLGPENVYLSIYESGSYDNTKGALVELDRMLDPLGVPRNITLSEVTHQDEIVHLSSTGDGWLQTEQTGKELRRIPYLSRLRNLSLQPLVDLAKQGIHFDRVLFLNDVVFTVRGQPIPGDSAEKECIANSDGVDAGRPRAPPDAGWQVCCRLRSGFLTSPGLLRHVCATRHPGPRAHHADVAIL